MHSKHMFCICGIIPHSNTLSCCHHSSIRICPTSLSHSWIDFENMDLSSKKLGGVKVNIKVTCGDWKSHWLDGQYVHLSSESLGNHPYLTSHQNCYLCKYFTISHCLKFTDERAKATYHLTPNSIFNIGCNTKSFKILTILKSPHLTYRNISKYILLIVLSLLFHINRLSR